MSQACVRSAIQRRCVASLRAHGAVQHRIDQFNPIKLDQRNSELRLEHDGEHHPGDRQQEQTSPPAAAARRFDLDHVACRDRALHLSRQGFDRAVAMVQAVAA